MTTVSQSTKQKLSLLQLAEELGNVSNACRIMGYHHDTFHEVQKAFKVAGVPPWSRGTLKEVGKIYVQVVVHAFCSRAFAKVYTSRMPITAADTLYDRVFPFYPAWKYTSCLMGLVLPTQPNRTGC